MRSGVIEARCLLPLAVVLVTACSGQPPAHAETGTATTQPMAAAVPDDTAGLGARIAAAYPGWRLTTEQEIGDRFPLLNGSTPEMFWTEWGSGSTWWVWTGDFDGDGEQDRLVILSNEADAAEDKLVVLHADGTHADLGGLGGWGVGISRRGEEVRGTLLQSDAIATIFWEKGADIVVWNPATRSYEPLESDCC